MSRRQAQGDQADIEAFLRDEAEEEAAHAAALGPLPEVSADAWRIPSAPAAASLAERQTSPLVRIGNRTRQARWRDRQRSAGLVQLRVWTHADDADQVFELAARLRRERGEPA